MHRADNRVRSGQRRINLRARRNCTLGFLRMVEQLLWELHCPRNIRDPPIKLGVAAFGQPKKNKIAGNECEYISQPIPSWPDTVVNPKNNRIQAVQVVGEHSVCWRLSLMSLTPAIKTRVIPNECEGPPKR